MTISEVISQKITKLLENNKQATPRISEIGIQYYSMSLGATGNSVQEKQTHKVTEQAFFLHQSL